MQKCANGKSTTKTVNRLRTKKREQTSSTFKAYFKVYEQHKSHCAPIEQNIKTKLKILYKKFNENKF